MCGVQRAGEQGNCCTFHGAAQHGAKAQLRVRRALRFRLVLRRSCVDGYGPPHAPARSVTPFTRVYVSCVRMRVRVHVRVLTGPRHLLHRRFDALEHQTALPVGPRGWAAVLDSCRGSLREYMGHDCLTPFPRRGSSSEPSMAVGALGRPLGAPPGPPGSA